MIAWSTVTAALTLAAEPRKLAQWELDMQRMFQGAFKGTSDVFPATSALLVSLGLLLLVVAIWGRRWHRQRHLRSAPLLVFHQLAGQMGLSLKQQWLLVRIAHQQSLPTPLTLMLSGATLAHHAGRYAESASAHRRESLTAKVDAIAAVLFDKAPRGAAERTRVAAGA